MKLLCVNCDAVMTFADRALPGDGTMAAVFTCPECGRETALLTNPMETRLVSGLGIEVGGRTVPPQPMELVRSAVATGGAQAFDDVDSDDSGRSRAAPEPTRSSPGTIPWSAAARERLDQVPRFVRGMVQRIYREYAFERGIPEITPEVMDQARRDLGLEGM